jgi:hypothetical protein
MILFRKTIDIIDKITISMIILVPKLIGTKILINEIPRHEDISIIVSIIG